MEELAMLAAGGLSSAAGSKLASSMAGGSNNYQNPQYITNMNQLLNNYMNKAINSSTGYTNQAIQQQNTGLQNATNAYQNYLHSGIAGATNTLNSGLNQYVRTQQPYASAGYNALDSYMGTLGLSTPTVGSGVVATANNIAPQFNSLLNQYTKNGLITQNPNGTISIAAAPKAPTSLAYDTSHITPQQIQQYINNNIHNNGNDQASYTGVNSNAGGGTNGLLSTPAQNNMGGPLYGGASVGQGLVGGWGNGIQYSTGNSNNILGNQQQLTQALLQDPQMMQNIQNYLAQQQYQSQMQNYNQALNKYNTNNTNFNNSFNSLLQNGLTPQMLAISQAYNQGLIS